jgi:hypothetical protein
MPRMVMQMVPAKLMAVSIADRIPQICSVSNILVRPTVRVKFYSTDFYRTVRIVLSCFIMGRGGGIELGLISGVYPCHYAMRNQGFTLYCEGKVMYDS